MRTDNILKKILAFKYLPIKGEHVANSIAALFILLFAYTAINKYMSIDAFKHVLKDYPLIGKAATAIAWAVLISELVVVAALFFPATRLLGLYGSLGLMTVFTLYLFYMLGFTSSRVCTCGGMLEIMTWPQHLVFNICCIVLAVTGIWLNKKRRRREVPGKRMNEQ